MWSAVVPEQNPRTPENHEVSFQVSLTTAKQGRFRPRRAQPRWGGRAEQPVKRKGHVRQLRTAEATIDYLQRWHILRQILPEIDA